MGVFSNKYGIYSINTVNRKWSWGQISNCVSFFYFRPTEKLGAKLGGEKTN
jgi:hypothetical protein